MQNIIRELETIVSDFSRKIDDIPEEEFSAKPLPGKWSKKEVLGHLIDSAQNNLRRFICGQYETAPPFIVYQQDFWVVANGYQHMAKEDVLELWRLLNGRIGQVLTQMPEHAWERECSTGTPRTLLWLAGDYVKHLKHHLNQIISGSFDVIYK